MSWWWRPSRPAETRVAWICFVRVVVKAGTVGMLYMSSKGTRKEVVYLWCHLGMC